jgi:diguanylate cyclase (GGDEF)-like protein
MSIDNSTILIGIAFSSAGMLLALLIGWLNARDETYLILGAGGIGLMTIALAILAMSGDELLLLNTLLPFTIVLAGFTLILAGVRLQGDEKRSLRPAFHIGGASMAATILPFILGYSGVGTIALNSASAILLFCCAHEHWHTRQGSRLAAISNVALFGVTAISFVCCAAVLIVEQRWVLTALPENWAESFNSIMCLVGLSGVGAFTLAFHHARSARRLQTQANTDSLTGMLNRRAIFERFEKNTRWPRTAALMLDLDHFKQVNDHLGHAEGDRVLKLFGQILTDHTGSLGVASRLGGEEFCCVLTNTDPENAKVIAENIRTAFADLSIGIGEQSLLATVSIGIAMAVDGETFSALLSRADTALYQAKRDGRNRVELAALRLVA